MLRSGRSKTTEEEVNLAQRSALAPEKRERIKQVVWLHYHTNFRYKLAKIRRPEPIVKNRDFRRN
jgi:hypothetical protein